MDIEQKFNVAASVVEWDVGIILDPLDLFYSISLDTFKTEMKLIDLDFLPPLEPDYDKGLVAHN